MLETKRSYAALLAGLMIGVGLVVLIRYWIWIPGLRIQNQLTDIDGLSFVEAQLVSSGKLGRYLWFRSLFSQKSDVYRVQKFERYADVIVQSLGIDGVNVSVDEWRNIFYAEKPPYVFTGFFKTTWEGQGYQVAVQEWPGKLGSRFVFYIFRFEELYPEKQKVLQQAFGGDFRMLITPALVFRDLGSCQKMTEMNEALCDLFLAENSDNAIIEKWIKKNGLPMDSSRNFYWSVISAVPDYRFYENTD